MFTILSSLFIWMYFTCINQFIFLFIQPIFLSSSRYSHDLLYLLTVISLSFTEMLLSGSRGVSDFNLLKPSGFFTFHKI